MSPWTAVSIFWPIVIILLTSILYILHYRHSLIWYMLLCLPADILKVLRNQMLTKFSLCSLLHIYQDTRSNSNCIWLQIGIFWEKLNIFSGTVIFSSHQVLLFFWVFCPPEISKVACKLKVSKENKNSIIFEDENYHWPC